MTLFKCNSIVFDYDIKFLSLILMMFNNKNKKCVHVYFIYVNIKNYLLCDINHENLIFYSYFLITINIYLPSELKGFMSKQFCYNNLFFIVNIILCIQIISSLVSRR